MASTSAFAQNIAFDKALVTDVGLIALLWFGAAAVVNPVGDFPLNDDWVFAQTVEKLLETGDYRPIGWAAMTLISNVIWGALFCLPAECNYTVLRVSTLVASFLCLSGAYVVVRELQQPRWLALLIALSLAVNPIYFALSYTFMTDVPFTAASIWTAVFLARSLKNGSTTNLVVGSLLAILAMLSRQIALCIPLAFAVVWLLKHGIKPRSLVWAAIPAILCASAWLGYTFWLEVTDRVPAEYYNKKGVLAEGLTNTYWLLLFPPGVLYEIAVYVGLFLLPLLLFAFKPLIGSDDMKSLVRANRRGVVVLVTVGSLVMVLCAALIAFFGPRRLYTLLMPTGVDGNILLTHGIGPVHIRQFKFDPNAFVQLPAGFWVTVTVLGVLGAVVLLWKLSVHAIDLVPRFIRRSSMRDSELAGVFLILCGCIYILPLLAFGPFFYDRYLVPFTLFIATGIAGISRAAPARVGTRYSASRIAACILLIAFGAYAICGTRDLLEWNRVRWQALSELMRNDHVPANQIDGGYEFNGPLFYEPRRFGPPGKSWWWVQDDTYQIGFGELRGYRIVKEYAYDNWLPPHTQDVVVLKRE